MVGAAVAFAAPFMLMTWARASGRRGLPSTAFAFVALAAWRSLPWLVAGCVVTLAGLVTRKFWVEHWLRATPTLRPLRVRRWAKAAWPAAVDAVGLGAHRAQPPPLQIVSVGQSIHALWTLPLGGTFAHVQNESGALAAFFDAPRLDIKPIRPSVVALTWRWDEPLAAARRADPPTPGTVCLADAVILGRDEAGADVTWSPLTPASHALVVGGTRSGKSICLQVLLAQVASMPDVRVCGVDPTGLLLSPFAGPDPDNLIALGTSSDSLGKAVDVLAHLVDVTLAERLEHLRETKADAIREPSTQRPLTMIVLEEYPAFLAACSADDTAAARKPAERLRVRAELYVQRLLAEGLKAALVVVLAAQRADADVLGGYRRDQMSTRIAFRLESADGWRMVLPGHPEVAEGSPGLSPGTGYLMSPVHQLTKFRGDLLDYAAYRDHVEQAMFWRYHHLSDLPL